MTDMVDVDAAIEEVIFHIEACNEPKHVEQLSEQLDIIRDLVQKSDTKPQVYIAVDGGVADVALIRGDVDVVLIDWDMVTPNSYIDPGEALDPMEHALEGAKRLPENEAIGAIQLMLEWLRDNLLDFPENDHYDTARGYEAEMVKWLSDHGAHP